MSSLHQDRLLVEGSGPDNGTASTLPSGRGSRRRTVGTREEQATVPTQRRGAAQQSEPTETTTTGKRSSGARAKAATVKAAATKAAATRAATAKAATAKAAGAARAAAVTTVANRTASARVARANAAAAKASTPKPAATKAAAEPAATKVAAAEVATKPAATKAAAKPAATKAAAKPAAAKPKAAAPKPAAAEPAAEVAAEQPVAKPKPAAQPKPKPAAKAEASTAAPSTTAPRPTPYKRTPAAPVEPVAAVPAFEPVADVAELLRGVTPDVVVVREDLPADPSTVAGRLPRFLRRRPAAASRRPAMYLAAALIGSLAVTTVTTGGPEARATANVSHSVSVAEQLGIEASDPTAVIAPEIATERLGELAASRDVRDAEQATAAQAQAEADRVAAEAAAAAAAAAAEAARPKAVAPVQGARLTSTFGPRWGTLHAGIDLAAPMLTPEFAVMDGVVLEAGPASGYGNAIYIQHENGDVTVYGHMEKILVEAGQVVRAGDTIALLGNRGQSTGPHLHFEVHAGGLNGTKIDPLPWLQERGVAL